MHAVIDELVARFDQGTLSRRQLISGLTALAAAGSAASAAAQTTPFRSTRIDHISIQVTDMARSVEFYEKIFGLKILGEDRRRELAAAQVGLHLLNQRQHRAQRVVHVV